eukprot:GHVS01064130.1.p1 GENE.GHVS01064130.1~~GHVS01064130.1.p1  ORF type:complete len:725 (+),score=160.88 GHVS01064130.1:114-2177(+)
MTGGDLPHVNSPPSPPPLWFLGGTASPAMSHSARLLPPPNGRRLRRGRTRSVFSRLVKLCAGSQEASPVAGDFCCKEGENNDMADQKEMPKLSCLGDNMTEKTTNEQTVHEASSGTSKPGTPATAAATPPLDATTPNCSSPSSVVAFPSSSPMAQLEDLHLSASPQSPARPRLSPTAKRQTACAQQDSPATSNMDTPSGTTPMQHNGANTTAAGSTPMVLQVSAPETCFVPCHWPAAAAPSPSHFNSAFGGPPNVGPHKPSAVLLSIPARNKGEDDRSPGALLATTATCFPSTPPPWTPPALTAPASPTARGPSCAARTQSREELNLQTFVARGQGEELHLQTEDYECDSSPLVGTTPSGAASPIQPPPPTPPPTPSQRCCAEQHRPNPQVELCDDTGLLLNNNMQATKSRLISRIPKLSRAMTVPSYTYVDDAAYPYAEDADNYSSVLACPPLPSASPPFGSSDVADYRQSRSSSPDSFTTTTTVTTVTQTVQGQQSRPSSPCANSRGYSQTLQQSRPSSPCAHSRGYSQTLQQSRPSSPCAHSRVYSPSPSRRCASKLRNHAANNLAAFCQSPPQAQVSVFSALYRSQSPFFRPPSPSDMSPNSFRFPSPPHPLPPPSPSPEMRPLVDGPEADISAQHTTASRRRATPTPSRRPRTPQRGERVSPSAAGLWKKKEALMRRQRERM